MEKTETTTTTAAKTGCSHRSPAAAVAEAAAAETIAAERAAGCDVVRAQSQTDSRVACCSGRCSRSCDQVKRFRLLAPPDRVFGAVWASTTAAEAASQMSSIQPTCSHCTWTVLLGQLPNRQAPLLLVCSGHPLDTLWSQSTEQWSLYLKCSLAVFVSRLPCCPGRSLAVSP